MRAWLRSCAPRLTRPGRTAAAIRAGAPIARGERVLGLTRGPGGTTAAATVHAIYLRRGLSGSWSRLGWDEVGRVGWDEDTRVLTLTRLRGDGPPCMAVSLPRRSALPELVRERVTWTVLASVPVLSRGQVCGRLSARRSPGDDRIRWVLTLAGSAASDDPGLHARVPGAIAELEAELGLATSGNQWTVRWMK
jgi:hypothetical protein